MMANQQKIDITMDKTGLASEEKIEDLYYKALLEAKIDVLTSGSEEEAGSMGYSTENFTRWARTIDISTLERKAADFSTKEHEQIVKEFGAFRHKVVKRLCEEFTYENLPLKGHLRDIGSCIDGSKVGTANEMDSLYIMEGDSLAVEKNHKCGLYHVYLGKDPIRHEIHPRRLRQQLADKYSEIISLLKVPDCLEHGGYNSSSGQYHQQHSNAQDKDQSNNSGYSGVRYNGPAVTSQFKTKINTLLTWDITPVVILNDDAELLARVRESDPMQAIITDNPEKMFPPNDVHLFPDAAANLWRLTTAEMEADVLARMSRHAPFKEAFSCGKVLFTELKKWGNFKVRLTTSDIDVVEALIQYNAIEDSATKKETAGKLNRKMRFAHIWIPTDRRDEYNEDKKSDISINNAAVKHCILNAASRKKGAFGPERNPDLVRELIRTAFQELCNGDFYSCKHAFLPGVRISHFSVAPSMALHKWNLARDIRQQCRTLLHEAVRDVSKLTANLFQKK